MKYCNQFFPQNINLMVLIHVALSVAAVYFFQHFNISFECNVALFVSPIVFPLAFSINSDYQRREKVYYDHSYITLFFCVFAHSRPERKIGFSRKSVQIKPKLVIFLLGDIQSSLGHIFAFRRTNNAQNLTQLISERRVIVLDDNNKVNFFYDNKITFMYIYVCENFLYCLPKVLEDLASFKSAGISWYFIMRELKNPAELDSQWVQDIHKKLKKVLLLLIGRNYCVTRNFLVFSTLNAISKNSP